MTIHEFNRYVPMGSKIVLYLQNENHVTPKPTPKMVGVVTHCSYTNDHTHYIQLLSDNGNWDRIPLSDISHVEILEMPDDYGTGENGTTVSTAVTQFLEQINTLMTPNNGIRPTLKDDFQEQAEDVAAVLEQHGLPSAALQVRSLAGSGSVVRMSAEEWREMFLTLSQTRMKAEETNDPTMIRLRRGEALLCIYARKQHFLPNALQYAARLIVLNLVQEQARVLPPSAYAQRYHEPEQAMDWFLLSHIYYAIGKQESLAYVAMVQAVLHRGNLFQNHINRRMFCRLCGGAHDFTFVIQLLSRTQQENGQRDAYPEQHLLDLGRLMCWMLYQMGGAGILDASELIHYVETKSHSMAQLQQLHELMLAYAYKYAPRNRKDRFLIVSAAIAQILSRIQAQDPLLDADALLERMKYCIPMVNDGDAPLYGYVYEFRGHRGVWLENVNGHILGTDLMPYWFNYPRDDLNRDIPMQLQNLYNTADEESAHLLVAVEFMAGLPGPHVSRIRAEDLSIISGGNITL